MLRDSFSSSTPSIPLLKVNPSLLSSPLLSYSPLFSPLLPPSSPSLPLPTSLHQVLLAVVVSQGRLRLQSRRIPPRSTTLTIPPSPSPNPTALSSVNSLFFLSFFISFSFFSHSPHIFLLSRFLPALIHPSAFLFFLLLLFLPPTHPCSR